MDPMTLKRLGEWRLEAMRRDARCRDAQCEPHAERSPQREDRVPRIVRQAIGAALVGAGLRVLGDQGA